MVCTSSGTAEPLGPSQQDDGINFALYSAAATNVQLVLYNAKDNTTEELQMNKSGSILCYPVCWIMANVCGRVTHALLDMVLHASSDPF